MAALLVSQFPDLVDLAIAPTIKVSVVRYADSPLGLDPTEIDYADYRDVNGVHVPFRMTLSQPGSNSTTQLEGVRQNVPVDAAKFAKPTPERSSAASVPAKQARPSPKHP